MDEFCYKARKDSVEYVRRMVNSILKPEQFGFRESFEGIYEDIPAFLIYDSEWCRVEFVYDGSERWSPPNIIVNYGRLHAPNRENFMEMKCIYWHLVWEPMAFLDGISAEEYATTKKGYIPDFVSPYWEKVLSDGENRAEWHLRMHRAIWEYYGMRLFELFDLRRPDLWERYRHFLKEFYRIYGWNPSPNYPFPPPWEVC